MTPKTDPKNWVFWDLTLDYFWNFWITYAWSWAQFFTCFSFVYLLWTRLILEFLQNPRLQNQEIQLLDFFLVTNACFLVNYKTGVGQTGIRDKFRRWDLRPTPGSPDYLKTYPKASSNIWESSLCISTSVGPHVVPTPDFLINRHWIWTQALGYFSGVRLGS